MSKMTMHEDKQKVAELFAAVLEQETAAQEAFLKSACGDDFLLREEIEKMLRSFRRPQAKDFLSVAAFEIAAEHLAEEFEIEADARIGETVGHYRIVRKIGAGGMGAIYLAERADDEISQRVAVKIIKRGMDTDQILRRFRHERQILANLEHLNIARFLDAGTTADGLPFFVMELVEGLPIDEFCRAKDLSETGRIELFRKVCQAVSFAHQKLIVHRDLKPSNILVNESGEPKLLDFGIAKLLDTTAEVTQTNLRALTPAYASPEQIRGEIVGTTSDVYSLGKVLYEILTGENPSEFKANSPKFKINSSESESQSEQFKSQTEKTGEGQRTKDEGLNLKGDLKTIVAKSLRSEPERRYSSVEKFSEDLRRYLNGLPITARPDAFSYRVSKFIQRNQFGVGIGIAVFLLFIFGAAAILWEYRNAQIAQAQAERRFDDTRQLAKAVIFKYYDEINKLQGATKVRAMMVADALVYLDRLATDEAATKDEQLRLELVEGYLRLGDVQGQPYGENLGDTNGAIESYRKAENLLGNTENTTDDLATMKTRATVYNRLSQMLVRQNSGGRESIAYAEKTVALREKILALEANTENRLEYARSYYSLAQRVSILDVQASLPILQKGSAITAELLQSEPENADLQFLDERLAGKYAFILAQAGGREMETWNEAEAKRLLEESVPYYQRSIESALQLAANNAENKKYVRSALVQKSNFAETLAELGKPKEAMPLQREAFEYDLKNLAADADNREVKFEVAEDYLDLSRTYLYLGEKQTAAEDFERGIKMLDDLIAADPQNAEFPEFQIANLTLYGDTQIKINVLDDALRSYQLAAKKRSVYPPPPDGVGAISNAFINLRLGDIYRFKSQKTSGALRQQNLQTSLEFYRRAVGQTASDNPRSEKLLKYLNEKIAECVSALS